MPTITVEGVPPGLLLRLAAAAAANGRCLNSEIIVHLARSANAGAAGTCRSDHRNLVARCGARRGGGYRCVALVGESRTGWGGPASGGAEGRLGG
jgi:uncharacterized protein YfiM (DUF2279 family)